MNAATSQQRESTKKPRQCGVAALVSRAFFVRRSRQCVSHASAACVLSHMQRSNHGTTIIADAPDLPSRSQFGDLRPRHQVATQSRLKTSSTTSVRERVWLGRPMTRWNAFFVRRPSFALSRAACVLQGSSKWKDTSGPSGDAGSIPAPYFYAVACSCRVQRSIPWTVLSLDETSTAPTAVDTRPLVAVRRSGPITGE